MTTRKHIDRKSLGSAQRDLHAFACAAVDAAGGNAIGMQALGYARLDRSEPTSPPGKGSA